MRLLRAHTRLGALPPNPQDLPLFFPPEWSSFLDFTGTGTFPVPCLSGR